jgi:hypothetical protein
MLDEAQAATRAEWVKEDERADLIRRQTELIQSGWQGAASEGALGATQPLVTSALIGAVRLGQAQDLLDRQSGSFHQAKNSVRPVPPQPPEMDILDALSPFSDYDQQLKDYQTDALHNIDVFRGYDSASEVNQTAMPTEYTTITQSGGDISVANDDEPRSGDGTHLDSTDDEQPRRAGGPPRGGADTGPVSGPPTGGTDTSPVSRPPTGGTDTSPFGGPPPGRPLVGTPPPTGPRQPQQTTPNDFVSPQSNPIPAALPGPSSSGGVSGPPAGGFYADSYGPRGVGTGSGPGSRGFGPGVRERGLGAGPGTGAIATEEAAARRVGAVAATRSGGGGMMGAPVGAGRGRSDDDEEHKRKVLIEADAEGLFGSDELTAPQVIGDDEYEDD